VPKYIFTLLRNDDSPKARYEVGDQLSIGQQVILESAAHHVLDVGQEALHLLFEQEPRNGRKPTFGDLLVMSTGDGHPFGYMRLENDGLSTAGDLNESIGPYETMPPTVLSTERGSIRVICTTKTATTTPDDFVDLGNTAQTRLVALRILAMCNEVDAANKEEQP
jgi:hypothetical protein